MRGVGVGKGVAVGVGGEVGTGVEVGGPAFGVKMILPPSKPITVIGDRVFSKVPLPN